MHQRSWKRTSTQPNQCKPMGFFVILMFPLSSSCFRLDDVVCRLHSSGSHTALMEEEEGDT